MPQWDIQILAIQQTVVPLFFFPQLSILLANQQYSFKKNISFFLPSPSFSCYLLTVSLAIGNSSFPSPRHHSFQCNQFKKFILQHPGSHTRLFLTLIISFHFIGYLQPAVLKTVSFSIITAKIMSRAI